MAHTLADAPSPIHPQRRFWPLDFVDGIVIFARSAAQVAHHRAFVGQLKIPIAANVLAFATYAAFLLFVLLPQFRAWFAPGWPALEGWRAEHENHGPIALLLGTAWFLWPVWFDVVAGPALEPLVAAAEGAVGGRGLAVATPGGVGRFVARLQQRARLFATQLLLLPLVWLVALIPIVGIPLVFLAAAAAAAAVFGELPAVRRDLPLRILLADLKRNHALALGYGVGCQIALAIPFLNLLLLAPAAAVGAVVLHFRFEKAPARALKKPTEDIS